MPSTTKIGTITINQHRTVEKHYECAAWYRKLTLQPGIFDLTVTFSPEHWPQLALFGQEGVVTESNFDSLFGGNIIAEHRNEDVGESCPYTTTLYVYNLAQQQLGKLDLLPEWEWLLLDSKEWHSHVSRLRVLAMMRSHGFNIVNVESGGQCFIVTIDDYGIEKTLHFHVNDEWHLIHSKNGQNCDLGDIREDSFRHAMYRFRHGHNHDDVVCG